jgi:hypothetical protein
VRRTKHVTHFSPWTQAGYRFLVAARTSEAQQLANAAQRGGGSQKDDNFWRNPGAAWKSSKARNLRREILKCLYIL